eukprot:jgi/Astpho2/2132/gw1.00039.6.1_t
MGSRSVRWQGTAIASFAHSQTSSLTHKSGTMSCAWPSLPNSEGTLRAMTSLWRETTNTLLKTWAGMLPGATTSLCMLRQTCSTSE